jgi:hypothetical protein
MKKLLFLFILTAGISAVFAQTPDWAKGRADEYGAIRALVTSALMKNGAGAIDSSGDAGTLSFSLGEPGTDSYVMNLYNVFTMCVGADRKNWPAIVEDYVGKVIGIRKEEKSALASLESYQEGKGLLFIKVYPIEYVDRLAGSYVGAEDIPGTLSVVVIDLPSSVTPLKPEFLAKWKKEGREVISAAKQNTFDSLRGQEAGATDLGEGQKLLYYYDESNVYVASLALDVPLVGGHEGVYGAFLGIPARSIVLIQPVDDQRYIYTLALNLAMNISDLYEKSSGPITANLYWCYHGKITLVKNELTGSQGVMEFPDALKALLK